MHNIDSEQELIAMIGELEGLYFFENRLYHFDGDVLMDYETKEVNYDLPLWKLSKATPDDIVKWRQRNENRTA